MDLDDEELEATRRINGRAAEKDVAEYKIKVTKKQSIELLEKALDRFEIRGEHLYFLKIAIKNILTEREQDKTRIKELVKRDKTLCNFVSAIFNGDVTKEFLPKQKIKDEIDSLRNMLKATTEEKLQEYTVEEIIIKINTLEDLLEDK